MRVLCYIIYDCGTYSCTVDDVQLCRYMNTVPAGKSGVSFPTSLTCASPLLVAIFTRSIPLVACTYCCYNILPWRCRPPEPPCCFSQRCARCFSHGALLQKLSRAGTCWNAVTIVHTTTTWYAYHRQCVWDDKHHVEYRLATYYWLPDALLTARRYRHVWSSYIYTAHSSSLHFYTKYMILTHSTY